jgi:hypothetical protein
MSKWDCFHENLPVSKSGKWSYVHLWELQKLSKVKLIVATDSLGTLSRLAPLLALKRLSCSSWNVPPPLLLFQWHTYTLTVDLLCSFSTLVPTYQTIWCLNPENGDIIPQSPEYLKTDTCIWRFKRTTAVQIVKSKLRHNLNRGPYCI